VSELVSFEQQGGVGVITVNNPPVNALSQGVRQGLIESLAKGMADPGISASEMVAAFAAENALATIVGTKTAGRLVAANAFKVGFGYRVALPIAAYKTWQGKTLEGVGVFPQIDVGFQAEAKPDKSDPQMDAALFAVR